MNRAEIIKAIAEAGASLIVFNIEDRADEYEEFDPKEAGRRAEFDAEMRLDAFGPIHG